VGLTRELARLSTDERVSVVLTVDPDIAAANSAEALDEYRSTMDMGALIVPGGATVIRVRPLSRRELDAAEDAASEYPGAKRTARGARLSYEMFSARADGATDNEAAEAILRFSSSLSDDDADLLRRHSRYAERRAIEIASRGLDSARRRRDVGRDGADETDEIRYVIEHSAEVAIELASYVERVSTLPKARLSPSV